jgi:hypothetical protein
MNSRFFIGLLLGVAITSVVVVFVNYHSMFSTQSIDTQSNQIKQDTAEKDSSDGVMVLVPNVKMKVAKDKGQASELVVEGTIVKNNSKIDKEKLEPTKNNKPVMAKESKNIDKSNSSDMLDQIATKMSDASTPIAEKSSAQQITISIAKYNNLEDADAMVGKLSLLGFSPIINQNQKDYEVVLIAANGQEEKLLSQELKKNNINFREI